MIGLWSTQRSGADVENIERRRKVALDGDGRRWVYSLSLSNVHLLKMRLAR